MIDFKYSYKNVCELNQKRVIDKDFIVSMLGDKKLISKIRYIDSAGEKWGSWDDVCLLINSNSACISFQNIAELLDPVFVANLGYTLTSFFIDNIDELFKYFKHLSYHQICAIFCRKEIVSSIINRLILSDKYLAMIDEIFFLQLLFAGSSYHIIHHSKEIELIDKFINAVFAGEILASSLMPVILERRKKSLSRKFGLGNDVSVFLDKPSSRCDPRLALFITGQLRGIEKSLPLIAKLIEEQNCNIDIFVSTWVEIGGLRISQSKINRHLEKEALEYLFKNDIAITPDIIELLEICRNTIAKNASKELLSSYFKFSKNVNINIKDDSEYPYLNMSNPEKMYYHNSFWVETLGHDFFENTYDYIIKIRPDMEFFDFNIKKILDSLPSKFSLYTEDLKGWIYREWGFGIGDQLLIGDSSIMVEMLALHGRDQLSTRVMVEILKKSFYEGHINCGIKAWLNGYDIEPNALIKYRLVDSAKITVNQVRNILTRS